MTNEEIINHIERERIYYKIKLSQLPEGKEQNMTAGILIALADTLRFIESDKE